METGLACYIGCYPLGKETNETPSAALLIRKNKNKNKTRSSILDTMSQDYQPVWALGLGSRVSFLGFLTYSSADKTLKDLEDMLQGKIFDMRHSLKKLLGDHSLNCFQ